MDLCHVRCPVLIKVNRRTRKKDRPKRVREEAARSSNPMTEKKQRWGCRRETPALIKAFYVGGSSWGWGWGFF